MRAKQKIVHCRGPSNINILASLFAPLMFAGPHNQSLLLDMLSGKTGLPCKARNTPSHSCTQSVNGKTR